METPDQSWLSLSGMLQGQLSTGDSTVVTAYLDARSLAIGTYTATIAIDAPATTPAPAQLTLQLDVLNLEELLVQAQALSHNSIGISWNSHPEAQVYRLLRRQAGGTWHELIVLPASETSYLDVDLQAETRYDYQVEVLDAAP